MNIQTISIVIPTNGCVNNCKFCVSKMHNDDYSITQDVSSFVKRIKYAVVNGVNTCILTGTGEALQNIKYLTLLDNIFKNLDTPFPNIELQTSGVLLTDKNIYLLKSIGVSTISLSVSNIFDDELNLSVMDVPKKLRFNLKELIIKLKEKGFNIRLSLNMTSYYDNISPEILISKCKEMGADQITFRELYHNNDDTYEQTKWVKGNKCNSKTLKTLKDYIGGKNSLFQKTKGKGNYLYTLPFGGKVYSIEGMSTVVDDDCMSKHTKDTLKYIILREDGKLYCRWDDKGSLIF